MAEVLYEPLVAFIVIVDRNGLGLLMAASGCAGVAGTAAFWRRLPTWPGRAGFFFGLWAGAVLLGSLALWLHDNRLLVRVESVRF
jgi:hypothetical protein